MHELKDVNLHFENGFSLLDFGPVFTHSLTDESLSNETNLNAIDILFSAEGEKLMCVLLKIENDALQKTFFDTGACANAMPAFVFCNICL